MATKSFKPYYSDEKIRKNVLKRQQSEIWTPEQIDNLAKHFKLKPGMKLLEAGCGPALNLRNFGPYCLPGGELHAVDSNENMLSMAEKLINEEGLINHTKLHKSDIYKLPFRKGTFNITLTHLVLCRSAKPEAALDELIRVTKKGGCIAVFENASSGGAESFWCNAFKTTMQQKFFKHEIYLRTLEGRKKAGSGDWSVGCLIPGWMEQRGLKNVDVRQCERVVWLAPPYKSKAQKAFLKHTREHYERMSKAGSVVFQGDDAALKAGGADDSMIKKNVRLSMNETRKIHKALGGRNDDKQLRVVPDKSRF